jgi:hypothetical protein
VYGVGDEKMVENQRALEDDEGQVFPVSEVGERAASSGAGPGQGKPHQEDPAVEQTALEHAFSTASVAVVERRVVMRGSRREKRVMMSRRRDLVREEETT